MRSIESLELHESPLPVRNFLVTLLLCAPNLRTSEGVTLFILLPSFVRSYLHSYEGKCYLLVTFKKGLVLIIRLRLDYKYDI